jgi:hypothetical protein
MKNTQLFAMVALTVLFSLISSNAMAAEECKGKKKEKGQKTKIHIRLKINCEI